MAKNDLTLKYNDKLDATVIKEKMRQMHNFVWFLLDEQLKNVSCRSTSRSDRSEKNPTRCNSGTFVTVRVRVRSFMNQYFRSGFVLKLLSGKIIIVTVIQYT